MVDKMPRLRDVFVPGGQPTLTYIERSARNLEEKLTRAIRKGGALISVTGPTKCGKTVLCRKVLSQTPTVWIDAGEVNTADQFWDLIVHKTDQYTTEQLEHSKQTAKTNSGKLSALSVATAEHTEESRAAKTVSRSRVAPSQTIALDALMRTESTLVIDDFHYFDIESQTKIIRALKQRIFDGLSAIVLAVPHRAYDAVKVETEMTGRLAQVPIDRWTSDELAQIASRGFSVLNVVVDDKLIFDFAEESFSSPHLMQNFCADVCIDNDIERTQETETKIQIDERDNFFGRIAHETQKTAFGRLARGPRQRSDRLRREFRDGSSGDIYVAVLKAIAKTGPASALTYEQIRSRLREVLTSEPPQSHEVTRVLQKMSEIAKTQIAGEPVLEWDEENKILHIIDPFFAFFLRWGELDVISTSQQSFG